MKSHAKAPSAGSTMRQASRLGRIFRGAGATRDGSGDADGSGVPSRRLLLCLPLALLFAGPFTTPAQAAPETIAEYGEGAGQVRVPKSTAVDQSSGDLYVADGNNSRVEKWDSEGNFLLGWGWGVADGVSQEFQICGPAASPPTKRCFSASASASAGSISPQAVAVDQSSGAVYVADSGRRRISKFSSSGQFIFTVGGNVNKAKAEEIGGSYTQAEKNICAAGETCQNGTSGTGSDEFSSPASLAVDSSGIVWVGDTSRLESFDSSGVAGAEIVLSGAGDTSSLALDSSGNFYVKSASFAGIRKLEAGTGTLLETLSASHNPKTVTLDEADNVYIGDCLVSNCFEGPPYRFEVFNPAGEQISQFGAGQVIGTPGGFGAGEALAVGESAERLYVAAPTLFDTDNAVQAFPLPEPGPLPENEHVTDLEPTTVTLAADLNPEGHETTYHFEWGTSEGYGESTSVETLAGEEFDSEAVAAELEELIPSTTYHFRLCATNSAGTVCGADTSFTTKPAVAIDAQWASEVSAHSATLNAELNPLGVTAQWWIEYGTGEGYGQSTPHGSLLARFGDVAIARTLTGLPPNTTYHYRFVATDERDGAPYTVHGADRSFTTQLSGLGFRLADGRAWEQVSPPQKYGASILAADPSMGGAYAAAADGNAVAYLSKNSTEANPEGSRVIEESSTLAHRASGGTWSNRDITPPHTEVTPVRPGVGLEYRMFSADLSRSLLQPRDSTPLSPQATEETPYLRHNLDPATYTPLLTGAEGFANVPEGTEFGQIPGFPGTGAVGIVAANPDLSSVLLHSSVPLATGVAGAGLYDWTAGELRAVSVRPSAEGGAVVSGQPGSGAHSTRKAISDDGSRVFWSEGNSALYVRDLTRQETARLDVVQEGAFGTGSAQPLFEGANAAGTVAFFTDTQNLTEDANATGADLYRCEVTTTGGELGCNLTDLTAHGGEDAEVQGVVSGMSDDGTHVYFVARGVLDGAPNAEGEGAIAGQPDLYLWQQGAGIRFVASLSEADRLDWGGANRFAAETSAAASPSGRYFAFMSVRSLTGYDNRDAITGQHVQEVFQYDAATGSLTCASCNPSGAAPESQLGDAEGAATSVLSDPQRLWEGTPVAAILPEATSLGLHSTPSPYRPRAVQDNGRLFFNAVDPLVPADSNGSWDVYEYEPTEIGDCSASSGGAATSLSGGGCVSLISSGTGAGESGFLDASEGGEDAFFITAASLSVTDEDAVNDVYDARVDGTPATLPSHSECQGEACQPPALAPNDATPASASFRGEGNLKPLARKRCGTGKRTTRRKGRVRCVPRRPRQHHRAHRRHRRAHHNDGGAHR